MANFTTVGDLRVDALWMAGEPSATTGAFYARALGYMNVVLTALLAGGALGAITLPKVDWWWARSATPGWITLLDAFNDDAAITATFTQNSSTVTYSSMTTGLSLLGYRLIVSSGSADQIAYVSAHTVSTTTSTISLAWKPATVATTACIGYKNTYALPTDFMKFSTGLRCSRSPYEIPLVDMRDLEKEFPRNRVWIGTPMAAALLIPSNATGTTAPAVHFSHVPTDGPWVIEFEYLKSQTALAISGTDASDTTDAPLPLQHRRVLSLGAAYLMLVDKNDGRQDRIGAMFRDAWDAMAMDDAQLGANNDQYGRLLAFPGIGGNSQPLRTSSGLIIG